VSRRVIFCLLSRRKDSFGGFSGFGPAPFNLFPFLLSSLGYFFLLGLIFFSLLKFYIGRAAGLFIAFSRFF
jgi:hypothetical protein